MGPCGGRGGAGRPPTVPRPGSVGCPGLRYEIDNVPPSGAPRRRPRERRVLGRSHTHRGVRAHLCHNPHMDGLAPSPRRSDRPMVSQNAGHGSDGRRRGPGGFGALEPTDDGNLSLGRRIGVLVVLAALGGAIILAAGGVGGNKGVRPSSYRPRRASPRASSGRPGRRPHHPRRHPSSRRSKVPLITSRTINLRVTVPDSGTSLSGLELRVYRNSKLLTSQKVTAAGGMKVMNVPLRRGDNKLAATIANAAGEGTPVGHRDHHRRRSVPPKLSVKSPRPNTTLNQSRVSITGKTEPSLRITGRNITSGRQAQTGMPMRPAPSRSRMSPSVRVAMSFSLQSRDAAGNVGTTTLVVMRGNGHLAANLHLSLKKARLKDLPRTMNATGDGARSGRTAGGGRHGRVQRRRHRCRLSYNQHRRPPAATGGRRWSAIQLARSRSASRRRRFRDRPGHDSRRQHRQEHGPLPVQVVGVLRQALDMDRMPRAGTYGRVHQTLAGRRRARIRRVGPGPPWTSRGWQRGRPVDGEWPRSARPASRSAGA